MNIVWYAHGEVNTQHGVAALVICVAAARRGIIDESAEAGRLALLIRQSSAGLYAKRLGALAEASLHDPGEVAVLMKRIALSFPPRRTAARTQAVKDWMLLATSALTGAGRLLSANGVFQLLPGPKPKTLCWRCDYIATFGSFGDLCDIDQCWICAASLRGGVWRTLILWSAPLEPVALRREQQL